MMVSDPGQMTSVTAKLDEHQRPKASVTHLDRR